MSDERLRKLAEVMVHYSSGVKPGDFVLIQAEEVAMEWIEMVAEVAIRAGAHVEVLVDLPQIKEKLLKIGSDEQLLHEKVIQKSVLKKADVWLTAWGTRNTKANTNIDSGKLQLATKGSSGWRKIYSERMGDGSLRWCGTQFPTHADAQEAEMSLDEYRDFVYHAGLLDTKNPVAEWEKIQKQQQKWVEYLNTKKEIHLVSEYTDLTVNVAGRNWINCAGHKNFPDGEIFTSPVESGINGFITFSFPGIYMGKGIEGIYMEIKDGKVITASAKKGEDLLKTLLHTDHGACYFGEFAIGTNYQIQKFTRNMLFDEKIGGTVHMALGDSMPEAGGKNRSAIHWDMLCNMRENGWIYADGELFYENGKFLI
jgi:aminopeptidase